MGSSADLVLSARGLSQHVSFAGWDCRCLDLLVLFATNLPNACHIYQGYASNLPGLAVSGSRKQFVWWVTGQEKTKKMKERKEELSPSHVTHVT